MELSKELTIEWLKHQEQAAADERGRIRVVENATREQRESMLDHALHRRKMGKATEATENLIRLLNFYAVIVDQKTPLSNGKADLKLSSPQEALETLRRNH